MVSRKISTSTSIGRWCVKALLLGLLGVLIVGVVIAGGFLVKQFVFGEDEDVEIAEQEKAITKKESSEVKKSEVKKIDFQPVVDEWVSSIGGYKSVLIYDFDREELVGEYNPTETYDTASLYKLFVVYEGYRRVQNKEWDANELAGTTGYTILECLDLSIRESYSPCAEALWDKIGQQALDEIIKNDFGITNSDISHLLSNSEDILKMMKLFYQHPDITDEKLLGQMKDSFLNQPITTDNWRQGLPSGFTRAKVYNKVGWDFNFYGNYWNTYHDAAIVEFPEDDRHFAVVVMTNQIPYQQITQLGTNIENAYYNNI